MSLSVDWASLAGRLRAPMRAPMRARLTCFGWAVLYPSVEKVPRCLALMKQGLREMLSSLDNRQDGAT